MSDRRDEILVSTANPTVKRLVRLRDNRTRRRERRLLVDGWRETRQAIDASLPLIALYVSEGSAEKFRRESGANDRFFNEPMIVQKTRYVSETILQRISFGESSRGVVAEFDQPDRSLSMLALPSNPLVLVLDGIEKPGNLGAVFRCADAAGVDAIILCDARCDVFNPNSIRSSLGAVFRVASADADEPATLAFLQNHSIRLVAARVESADELWSAEMSRPIAIILGSEAHGLQSKWQSTTENEVRGVRIPMFGAVDSLNVSASAAIMLFESQRQSQETSSET